jgi:predicted PhzF superfamily epimerase YddE/YHI9
VGVPEDPVTGSAHCTIGGWWFTELGVTELRAEQWSPRGGSLHLTDKGTRIGIAGRAVTVLTGQLLV